MMYVLNFLFSGKILSCVNFNQLLFDINVTKEKKCLIKILNILIPSKKDLEENFVSCLDFLAGKI